MKPVSSLLRGAFGALLLLAPAALQAQAKIILATTTSTADTGLLDHLLPTFKAKTGIEVKAIAVGTGEALAMGRRGDADVLLVHSRKAEDAFMAEGFGALRLDVMHNDFLLVGPATDPAKAQGQAPAEALKRIAAAGAPFVTRGDDSGTHKKELELWKGAALAPAGQAWYLSTGQGMGESARIADQKQAYLLIDRGTYLALKATLKLVPIAEGDKALFNPYGVIVVNPAKHPKAKAAEAKAFAEWLVSEEGQALIGAFGKAKFGQPLFFPDAKK